MKECRFNSKLEDRIASAMKMKNMEIFIRIFSGFIVFGYFLPWYENTSGLDLITQFFIEFIHIILSDGYFVFLTPLILSLLTIFASFTGKRGAIMGLLTSSIIAIPILFSILGEDRPEIGIYLIATGVVCLFISSYIALKLAKIKNQTTSTEAPYKIIKNKQTTWGIFFCATLIPIGYALPWIGGKSGFELINIWIQGLYYLPQAMGANSSEILASIFNGNRFLLWQLIFLIATILSLLLSLMTIVATLLKKGSKGMAIVITLTVFSIISCVLLQRLQMMGFERAIDLQHVGVGAYVVLLGSLALFIAATVKRKPNN